MPQPTVVKRYKSEKEYQKDVIKMARKNYKVISVVSMQQRRSFFTVIMTGFLAILFPRKPELVVTYSLA